MPRPQVPDILGAVLTPDQTIRDNLRYDYSQVDEANRAAVQAAAVAIVRSGRKAQESLIDIGQRLTAAKELLPHGQFSDWCQVEFDMSQRTAQRMMAVAATFGGKSDTVSFLSDSALYLLSGPSVPEEARQEVITEAQAAGASPTKAQVQAVIDKHKPAPPSYASVWEIRIEVGSVIAQKWPGDKQSAAWISAMRAAARTTDSALLHDVEEALELAGIEYRRRDLVQAINDVADALEQDLKRRQAAPAPPPAAPPSAPIAAAPIDIPIKRAATPPTYEDLCKLIAARPNLKAKDLRSAIRQRKGHWLFNTIMASVETAHPGAWSQTRVVNAMMHVADQLDRKDLTYSGWLQITGKKCPCGAYLAITDYFEEKNAAGDITNARLGAHCYACEGEQQWRAAQDLGWYCVSSTTKPPAATANVDAPSLAAAEPAAATTVDSEAAGAIAANDGIDDEEATAFAAARVHLGDALTSLKAAKSVLGGWHDELANMIDEIAAHVRHAAKELD